MPVLFYEKGFVAVFLAFSLHGKAGMYTAAEQSNQTLITTVEIRILS